MFAWLTLKFFSVESHVQIGLFSAEEISVWLEDEKAGLQEIFSGTGEL